MKKSILFAFTLSMVLIGAWFFSINSSSERDRYEQFILEKASDISNSQDESPEGLKAPDKLDMAAFSEYVKTLDPELGVVPTKRLLKAYLYTTTLKAEQKSMHDYEPNMN